MSKAEEYLKKNVKEILQPMLKKIIQENPSEPVIKIYNIYYFILFIDPFHDKISHGNIQYKTK